MEENFLASFKDMISVNIARFNRIRRKPPIEILTYLAKRYRIALIHSGDRIRLAFGEITFSDKDLFEKINLKNPSLNEVRCAVAERDFAKAKNALILHMCTRKTPCFFFDPTQQERLILAFDKTFPHSRAESVISADEIIRHRFKLLGQEVTFDHNIDWHFALNNQKWPLTFSPNIDYFSSSRPGDIKLPWELNRTQHFIMLGKAYWLTADEKYAEEFTEELLSWIRDNPYKLGINWMEGIETSIRLISWSWAYYFFVDSKPFEKVHFEFLKSIYIQTKFIERHLSDKWQLNNNHLIAEATGLTMMGILFPEFSEAPKWVKKGLTVLERELEKQILPDGFTWEYSTGYHKFVTDFILLIVVLMQKNKMEIPEQLSRKLDAMIEFLNCVTKSDGMIPLIGDDDDGRVIKLTESAYADTRSTITVGSHLYPSKDLPRAKSEEVFWLLGEKEIDWEKSSIVQNSRFFKDSGLFVMRDLNLFLMFIAGPQNPKYTHAPHRHLDDLSFVLNAYDTNFIVDSGTFTYNGDFTWRKYFKGRIAHNTGVIDEQDPVQIEAVFETPRVPITEICGYLTNDKFDWVASKYNGYKDLTHIRHIFFVKSEYWLVVDLLKGSGDHTYDLYFHFNSDLETKFDDVNNILVFNAESTLKIISMSTAGLYREIFKVEISPQYGVKTKTSVLRFRRKGPSPQIFATILFPFRNGSVLEKVTASIKISRIDASKLERAEENEKIRIEVAFGEYSDYFTCSTVNLNNNGSVFFRELHR